MPCKCLVSSKTVRSPGTGVTDSHKLPCGGWELNLSSLEEQPVLVTVESSLEPLKVIIFQMKFPESPTSQSLIHLWPQTTLDSAEDLDSADDLGQCR